MPNLALLARDITQCLAPMLPYLVAAGEGAAKSIGEHVPDAIKAIWDRLQPHIRAKDSVAELAENPDDDVNRTVLERQLVKLLESNPALAAELTPWSRRRSRRGTRPRRRGKARSQLAGMRIGRRL